MISDHFDYYGTDPRSSSWEKVTKRIVDPITFSCHMNVVYVPRIEDCSYETTNIAIAKPLFGEMLHKSSSSSSSSSSSPTPKRTTVKTRSSSFPVGKLESPIKKSTSWMPHNSSNKKPASPAPRASPVRNRSFNPSRVQPPKGVPSLFASSPKAALSPSTPKLARQGVIENHLAKNKVSPTRAGGDANKVASLGAFFSKASIIDTAIDADNQSMSSKSMSSKSVSDRSHAERSKAEQNLKKSRAKEQRASVTTSNLSTVDTGMMPIDEQSCSEFKDGPNKKGKNGGSLGNFLDVKSPKVSPQEDDDNRSAMSGSTIGSKSVSLLSNADRSKNEKKLRTTVKPSKWQDDKKVTNSSSPKAVGNVKPTVPKKPIKSAIKKKSGPKRGVGSLTFQDGHDAMEVPRLNDTEYYAGWDDIWYSEEELSDMRYEAFLEEAGLDVDEYMNM